MSPSPLARTLKTLTAAAPQLADDWWVVGSAGMALAGAAGLEPPDVDLLTSERDARRLAEIWNLSITPPVPSQRFRSKVFVRAAVAPLPIEIMAGLEVMAKDRWVPLRPGTRVAAPHPAGTIFIPSVAEQIAICRLFGRPKDLARIPLLEALS
jgi:hypothetical protein